MSVYLDEVRHEYAIDGVRVPSVTQVLQQLHDFSHVPADVLEAKRELGTAVHLACELDDGGDLVEESVHASVRPYLDAYRLFKSQKVTEVIAAEQIVHHPAMRYAGKLDLLARIEGYRWVIDFKTPLVIHPAVGLQTAGYAGALQSAAAGPLRRAALQLKPDGTYRLHEFRDPNDWPTFVACLTLFRWKEKHA